MTPKAMVVWGALLGGALYLATRSSSAATCEPAPEKPDHLPPAGGYVLVAVFWDKATCAKTGPIDEMPVDQATIDIIKSKIGTVPGNMPVPEGVVGYGWVYDDKGAVVLAIRRASGAVLEQI